MNKYSIVYILVLLLLVPISASAGWHGYNWYVDTKLVLSQRGLHQKRFPICNVMSELILEHLKLAELEPGLTDWEDRVSDKQIGIHYGIKVNFYYNVYRDSCGFTYSPASLRLMYKILEKEGKINND